MYRGPIIDVDVHHNWRSPSDVVQYLPTDWRTYVSGGSGPALPLTPGNRRVLMVDSSYRVEAIPEDGSLPGTDYELMKRQLLDPLGSQKTILTYDIGLQSGLPNPEFAAALCRAANQYTVEQWLPRDDRLCGLILVPTSVPEDAAREIAHWANHPRMVGVLVVVNSLGRPFGHPIYDPIYRAAAEHGLPISIHLSGPPEGRDIAGGNPSMMLERYTLFGQAGMHHLTSMITNALFEKFPTLRVMLVEWGFDWLPSVANRLDTAWPILRVESPRVRRLPSEVIREHLRFSTQPFEYVPARALSAILDGFEGIADVLCFSSDYPHWDADDPTRIVSRVPEDWHSKLFYENAAAFFGFGPPVAPPVLAGSAQHA
ncbi:amidohydrolase family protein [Rhodococcus koreensis]